MVPCILRPRGSHVSDEILPLRLLYLQGQVSDTNLSDGETRL